MDSRNEVRGSHPDNDLFTDNLFETAWHLGKGHQASRSGNTAPLIKERPLTPAKPAMPAGSVSTRTRVTQVLRSEAAARLFIVDRDPMSSELLAAELTGRHQVRASAVLPDRLMSALAAERADLLVISADLGREPGSGCSLAQTVKRTYPRILMVILLDQSSKDGVIAAFHSGARGVFCREQPIEEFIDCIDHVGRGYLWAGCGEADVLLHAFQSIPAPIPSQVGNSPVLTRRELQVAEGAAMGKTNRMIAHELRMSEHTVKNYLFRAFEKLGISRRVELLFYLTMNDHRFGSSWSGLPAPDAAAGGPQSETVVNERS